MRVETRPGDGYERIRAWDSQEGRERYTYVHRLSAVAWGILDGLDDERHVHHGRPIPWLNTEGNLFAVDPTYHGSIERRRQLASQERDGVISDV
jgi:hypothetical protein